MHPVSDKNVEKVLKRAAESEGLIQGLAPLVNSLGMSVDRIALLLRTGRQMEVVDYVRVGLSVWFDRDLAPFMTRLEERARDWKLPRRYLSDAAALESDIFGAILSEGGLYSLE